MTARDLLRRLAGRWVLIRYVVADSVEEEQGCLEKVENGVIVLSDPMYGTTTYPPDRVVIYKITVHAPCKDGAAANSDAPKN